MPNVTHLIWNNLHRMLLSDTVDEVGLANLSASAMLQRAMTKLKQAKTLNVEGINFLKSWCVVNNAKTGESLLD